jgi:hypothetical protein
VIEVQQNLIIDLADIDYKATKAEPMVMYYRDGSGYPGSPAECEVHAVWMKLKDSKGNDVRVDILPLIQDEDALGDLILEELDKEAGHDF